MIVLLFGVLLLTVIIVNFQNMDSPSIMSILKMNLLTTNNIIANWDIEYSSDDVTKNFFSDFSVLDTMYQWSMMKNIHSPNWMGIGSWGPEIWRHEYLISPIEISVNWSGSKQL